MTILHTRFKKSSPFNSEVHTTLAGRRPHFLFLPHLPSHHVQTPEIRTPSSPIGPAGCSCHIPLTNIHSTHSQSLSAISLPDQTAR